MANISQQPGTSVAQCAAAHATLTLDAAEAGHSYIIVEVSATGRNRMHMDSLGLIRGDVVHVLFSNFSGLVIGIKGSRLALSRRLARALTVQEFCDEAWGDHCTVSGAFLQEAGEAKVSREGEHVAS